MKTTMFISRIFMMIINTLRRKNKQLKEEVKILEEQLYAKGGKL